MKRRRKSSDEGEESRGESAGEVHVHGHVGSEITQGRGSSHTDIGNGLGRMHSNGEPDSVGPSLQPSMPTRNESTEVTPTLPLSLSSSSSAKQNDLIRYLFAPNPVLDLRYGYNDTASIRQCEIGESDLWEEMGGDVWTEAPSSAHLAMDQEAINE